MTTPLNYEMLNAMLLHSQQMNTKVLFYIARTVRMVGHKHTMARL